MTEKNKKEKGSVLHRKWEGGKSGNFEKKDKKISITTACQTRRKNTELQRKKGAKNLTYSDNDPPDMAGDRAGQAGGGEQESVEAENGNQDAITTRKHPPTCPHF